MEPSVTERLVKFLRDQGTDFVTLGKLSALPAELKKQITPKGRFGANVQKTILPYLGDALILKRGSRSTYLVLKQGDEDLLFGVVAARAGKSLGVISRSIPFKKDDFLATLNSLLEHGRVRVTKINKSGGGYVPCLAPASGLPSPGLSVSEEAFLSAFGELEWTRAFVRICDLRRRLGWPRADFDAMLRKLRDAGTVQLHAGNVTTQTHSEIEDGFVDENGYRMGNVTRNA
ncbi:hypothetical protein AGMMS49957_01530 [Synergistales bacterium]|nr:hypothetical protein AGMMS49957_01530 [Synergistales bacterium]